MTPTSLEDRGEAIGRRQGAHPKERLERTGQETTDMDTLIGTRAGEGLEKGIRRWRRVFSVIVPFCLFALLSTVPCPVVI